MQSVINFIKGSPKRYEIFKEMLEQAQHQNKHELRPLCPTRWVMKLASVDIFLQHYPTVLEQLEITQNDRQLTSENRVDARSYLRALEEFDTYFGMRVFQKLLSITNPVHIQCQGRSVTVGDVRVTTLVSILLSQFSDDQIAIDFYQEVKQAAHYLMIDQPQLPRIPL